jgi:hypothetical protein
MLDKQDSNQVGLYLAREVNGDLPLNPVFYTREPNSYSKFGGSYKMVARNPFNPSRQNKKGTTSDLDSSGGWQEDVTQSGMFDLMEGFFFAAIRKKAVQAVSAVDAGGDDYTIADGAGFPVGAIAFAHGFDHAANNGPKHVVTSAGGVITVAEPIITEAIVVGAAKNLTRVGNKFGAGDCALSLVGNMVALTFTAADPTLMGLIPGEWIFVGGDLAATQFATVKPGYARISSIDGPGKVLYLDKFTSAVGGSDAGAGKTIELYYGFLVKNEDDESLIVKSTFTAERPLGKDNDGTQSDSLSSFVLSDLKWNSPLSNKATIDITGVGLDYAQRSGLDGLIAKQDGAVIVKALGEEAFNTSLNVFRIRLSVVDPVTYNPLPLFARCTEFSININNNVTASKSQGTLGGFDTTVGQFTVTAALTAYFNSIAAIAAIRESSDCTFDAIYAKHNAGIVLDLPLVTVGGGELTIAQNQPIMMPLTNDAAQSHFGHTALFNFFPYLPNSAMSKGG